MKWIYSAAATIWLLAGSNPRRTDGPIFTEMAGRVVEVTPIRDEPGYHAVDWPGAKINLVVDNITLPSQADYVQLLYERGIRADRWSEALVYELNPDLNDIAHPGKTGDLKLPTIESNDVIRALRRDKVILSLRLDPEILQRMRVSTDACLAIANDLATSWKKVGKQGKVDYKTEADTVTRTVTILANIVAKFDSRRGRPLRKASMLELVGATEALDISLRHSKEQDDRIDEEDVRIHLGVYETAERERQLMTNVMGDTASKPDDDWPVDVTVSGTIDSQLEPQIGLFCTRWGHFDPRKVRAERYIPIRMRHGRLNLPTGLRYKLWVSRIGSAQTVLSIINEPVGTLPMPASHPVDGKPIGFEVPLRTSAKIR